MYAQAGLSWLTYAFQIHADVGNFWIQHERGDNAICLGAVKVGHKASSLSLAHFIFIILLLDSLRRISQTLLQISRGWRKSVALSLRCVGPVQLHFCCIQTGGGLESHLNIPYDYSLCNTIFQVFWRCAIAFWKEHNILYNYSFKAGKMLDVLIFKHMH